MRSFLFVSATLVEAARTNLHAKVSAEARSFVMLESVATASGFMNMTFGADHAEENKICDSLWPSSLNSQFKNSRFVGSGATACVYLAEDKHGQTVAIKVGKQASAQRKDFQLKEWTDECNDMKELRVKACEGGPEVLKMHENYMPSCFSVGQYSKGAYYAMHAAGPTPIRDAPEQGFDVETKKRLFAQLVQSIYSLHVVDMSHNDLHGHNIVLHGDKLQLIDLGSLKTVTKSWKKGYKRDSNAIWRWGAILADCGEEAQWSHDKSLSKGAVQGQANAYSACVAKNWNPDAEFITALGVLLKGDVHEDIDHHIKELYATRWIQDHVPELESKFVSDVTGDMGCLDWSKGAWEKYWFKQDYPNHVKCETIPAFHWQTKKTKKGKTRITDRYQCDIPGRTFDSACYKTAERGAEIWACGGCDRVNEQNPQACFFKSHPDYEKVPSYGE